MEVQAVVAQPTACFLYHSHATTAACVSHIFRRNLCSPSPLHHLSCSPFRRKVSAYCTRSPVASFASLGFSADPRISIERAANTLLKDAASLLLYQEVLRVPPAQAFLKVLLALRRGDEGWKLLDAYGEFYRLMAAGHFLSWEELILEGILTGEGNPFTEASANVGNSRSPWSKGVPPSLQAAAATDLDSLQRLSVTECTLVGWVTDLVSDLRPEWKVAAEATLSSRDVKIISTSTSGKERSTSDQISSKLDKVADLKVAYSMEALLSSDHGSDALANNRETWRRKIGGLWRWSEAVPLLQEYYAQFGIGRTASEQALQCRGGKLLRDMSFYAFKDACSLRIHKEHRERLSKHLQRHILPGGASHILVYGPNGSGKTCLVKSVLHEFVKQGKLRVVQMQRGETKHLQGILEELARNWQLRFVLVIDGLSIADELVFMEWPENVMLCGISLSREPSTNKLSDEFRDMFGMVLTLEDLDSQSYLLSVNELLEYNERRGLQPTENTWRNHTEEAELWAKDRKVLSVRTAAQFVKSIT